MKRNIFRWPKLTVLTGLLFAILCLTTAPAFGQATSTGTVVGTVNRREWRVDSRRVGDVDGQEHEYQAHDGYQ